MKLWKGRFQKEADPKTNDFNSSISFDSRKTPFFYSLLLQRGDQNEGKL